MIYEFVREKRPKISAVHIKVLSSAQCKEEAHVVIQITSTAPAAGTFVTNAK